MSEKKSHEPDDSAAIRRRSVRSFVIRGGRATAAQQRALNELWPRFGIDLTTAPLDLDRIFQRRAPRMMEIGFGAGEALLEFAAANPQIDCIGIEVHPPGIGHLMLGAHTAGLQNVRVISHDAVDVLQRCIEPASIDVVHVFFPDPWPKKRHHKRRLIQAPFVELLARALKPYGTLRLATDWEHYAHHMREVLDSCALFENVSTTGFVERSLVRPLTRFERRGQRLGHNVWDLEYRRRATST